MAKHVLCWMTSLALLLAILSPAVYGAEVGEITEGPEQTAAPVLEEALPEEAVEDAADEPEPGDNLGNDADPEGVDGAVGALASPSDGDDTIPEIEKEQGDDPAPVLIYEISMDAPDEGYLLPWGGDPSALPVPDTAYALYGQFRGILCPVEWRFEAFDSRTPGQQTLEGDVVLPDGYAFEADPIPAQVTVYVYEADSEEKLRVTGIDWSRNAVVIPLGASRDEFPGYLTGTGYLRDSLRVHTEDGRYMECPFTLNLDAIDTTQEGTYYPVTLELPAYVELDEITAYYQLSVHVVPVDEVDLRAITYIDKYYVRWIYEAESPVLWMAVDGGVWLEADIWGYEFSGYGEDTCTELMIHSGMLSEGHIYEFYVQYEGDRQSNGLQLDLLNHTKPQAFSIGGDRNGGDRGGSEPPDTEEPGVEPPVTGPPDVGPPTQPPETEPPVTEPPVTAPPAGEGTGTVAAGTLGRDRGATSGTGRIDSADLSVSDFVEETPVDSIPDLPEPNEPQPSPEVMAVTAAAPEERSDRYSITVSGRRLAAMMEASPSTVFFHRGELQVSIPTPSLAALELSAADTFTTILYMPDGDSFAVGFAVNDAPMDGLDAAFLVSIPWEGSAVSCGLDNSPMVVGEVDKAAGRAGFSLDCPGTYTLIALPEVVEVLAAEVDALHAEPDSTPQRIAAQDAEDSGSDPVWPVILAGAVGLLGASGYAGFAWKKRGRIS